MSTETTNHLLRTGEGVGGNLWTYGWASPKRYSDTYTGSAHILGFFWYGILNFCSPKALSLINTISWAVQVLHMYGSIMLSMSCHMVKQPSLLQVNSHSQLKKLQAVSQSSQARFMWPRNKNLPTCNLHAVMEKNHNQKLKTLISSPRFHCNLW